MDKSTPSADRYYYSGCAYCFAFFYRVRQDIFKCWYCEHRMKVETTVLGEEGKSAPDQGQEWDSSGEDGGVAGIRNELGRGEKLRVAMEGE